MLKPSEDACQSVLALTALLAEAGLPKGALNVVTGLSEEAGAALSAHPGIDFITFTGSPEAGTKVQQAAALNHVRCVLELGGKSPKILFDDANFDVALPVILNAILQNAGQTCSAGSRVLIQRSRYVQWSQRLAAAFTQASAGLPAHNHTCGPLINARQQGRVARFIDQAITHGVPVLGTGSIAADAPPEGFFVALIVFGPVPRQHPLEQEEVFGPVLALLPFEDEADAIALANDTPTAWSPACGPWTPHGKPGCRKSCGVARCSSTATAPVVASSCPSAGWGAAVTAGKKASWRWKKLARPRQSSSATTFDQSAVFLNGSRI